MNQCIAGNNGGNMYIALNNKYDLTLQDVIFINTQYVAIMVQYCTQ